MTYPPPPMLAFIAYMYGHITAKEYERMIKLWEEKHKTEPPKEVSGDA